MKPLRHAALLLLLLSLPTSCREAPAAAADDVEPGQDHEQLLEAAHEAAEEDPTESLRITNASIASAGGDLTALPAHAAESILTTWIDQLAGEPRARYLVEHLRGLRSTIGATEVDGRLAGLQLLALAEDVRELDGGATAGLAELVTALEAGADNLLTSDRSTAPQDLMGRTLAAARFHRMDLSALGPQAGIATIEEWIAELRGVSGGEAIVLQLEQLREELSAPTIDGGKVGTLLSELAEDTHGLRDENRALAALAFVLEAGGRRLRAAADRGAPPE